MACEEQETGVEVISLQLVQRNSLALVLALCWSFGDLPTLDCYHA